MSGAGGALGAHAAPTFREAFLYWLRLGFVNFGGPSGQIAMMHRDLVDERRWISEERFLHALNYCMLLPGPEAQQLAIYVGWLLHRTWGGIVAGVLFVLPSVAVLLALSWLYVTYGTVSWVAGLFAGLQAVVLAIVVHAVWRIGRKALKRAVLVGIAVAAFAALVLGAPFPLVILGAALAGYAAGKFAPGLLPTADAGAPAPGSLAVDRGRALRILGVGALLWALPVAVLLGARGRMPVLADVGLFFSKAALVTFGGAYAVLAYIGEASVATYGWLRPEDVAAGLGLAESTPGPLIMVVCFIGFLAGHANPGPFSPALGGILGGLVATYFTFLFSFLFIFLGAPYVERLRGRRALSAALAAVTAAVVGVIANLALFFGEHVLFAGGTLDPFAAVVAGAAFVALVVFDASVVAVVAAGAGVGVAARLLGIA